MTRITITATDTGFSTMSPVGDALAPNVFLRTGVNIDGTVISFDGSNWQTSESLRYDTQDIFVTISDLPAGDAQLGQTSFVSVTSINYYSMIDGNMTVIGTLELSESLAVQATLQSFGVDDTPAWHLDLGAALEDLLQNSGFDFNGGAGDDIFNAHTDMLPFRGVALINGFEGNDTLHGTLGRDKIKGGSGDDTLYDPDGVNVLRGGAGNDSLTAGNGSDGSLLHGGSGHDVLTSGRGADLLKGGSGSDILNGGAGDDVLIGGRGRDTLTGGQGADTFVFNTAERGHDAITDFENGVDTITFEGLNSFADLTITQRGADVWIDQDGAGRLKLLDTDISLIDASDFIFI